MPNGIGVAPSQTAARVRKRLVAPTPVRHSSAGGINRQNEPGRSARLAHTDPRARRQWLAKQRYRGAHALELPALNGISYALTAQHPGKRQSCRLNSR